MGDIEMRTNKKNSGFTLVEILIVVVILGILAAIVIPQFTQASTEAMENSLKANLQTMRSQIELYKIQHNDDFPGTVAAVTFEQAMEGYTLIDGTSCLQGAANALGPYLQSIPVNPFNLLDTVDTAGGAIGDNSHGWSYNTTTNVLRADDNTDADGDGTLDHILW